MPLDRAPPLADPDALLSLMREGQRLTRSCLGWLLVPSDRDVAPDAATAVITRQGIAPAEDHLPGFDDVGPQTWLWAPEPTAAA